jgi:hypothetical protein
MSQMTSTARVGARAIHRPATERPRLRVVTGAPLERGGAVLMIICAALLAAGLIGVLLLNTALAQGSFTLHDLRTTSENLTDAQGALNQSLDASRSPANLATRAAEMGMVPAQSAAFLRLSDGKVIGVSQQASPGPPLTVVGTPSSARARAVPAAPLRAKAAPASANVREAKSTSARAGARPPGSAAKPARR